MPISEIIRRKPTVAKVVTCLLFVIAGSMIWSHLKGSATESLNQSWYFDINTSRTFKAPSNRVPPIEAPSGPTQEGAAAGVRAYVFSCGNCENKSDQFVGYLEQFKAEDQKRLIEMRKQKLDDLQAVDQIRKLEADSKLISTPDKIDWVAEAGPAGEAILRAVAARCPEGDALSLCMPGI